ncbi:diaminohydroxyphosphoribosylaminopyrimidine deaminase [Stanieria cyanosphaera PCC 7437]|uniref:Riboflavin biosynthesis protein RibD n=1 Tax=Stanieria cyanosphaera (strain ATCC 29371 / PCC 7437) TaxID=111780 RepID=K9XRP7_STAC7|nr:bifunctional diaminohydroxyphosphoribosylaminopyrimidine deaminase/5-amino-6-(5-phosphoribosylamino)uracil reductase RibD [Stanieria cyanosphaera]AFZ35193.1 diaminohydroxyphosphoribosylaminopyrimidine deaminase [Stanieria cyanosphaera PCC 7437]
MDNQLNDNSQSSSFDCQMMQRCLQLASRASGHTSPNPLVGSVVVQAGNIVGEGFHPGAGKPHAEVFALQAAGEQAKGATIYVNLEPCNHYGRTPPCTEALIAAQVAKVVVGMVDPNPLVSGKGIERLRDRGIEVIVGVEEEACRQLNEAFIHRILHQRPFGILKYAMTLDGKIATSTGHSAWVTTPASRHLVHQLRSACDAIIIGGNTVRRDNPQLTTHGTSDRNPLRVVMSRNLDLPEDCQLWHIDQAATIVFTETNNNSQLRNQLEAKGVEVVSLTALTPQSVMKHLYDRELSSILWECGGILAAQAIADGAVQKIMAFIAPKIIGGQAAPSPVGNLGLIKMTDALKLENIKLQTIDSDILIEGYLNIEK